MTDLKYQELQKKYQEAVADAALADCAAACAARAANAAFSAYAAYASKLQLQWHTEYKNKTRKTMKFNWISEF